MRKGGMHIWTYFSSSLRREMETFKMNMRQKGTDKLLYRNKSIHHLLSISWKTYMFHGNRKPNAPKIIDFDGSFFGQCVVCLFLCFSDKMASTLAESWTTTFGFVCVQSGIATIDGLCLQWNTYVLLIRVLFI